MSTATPAKERRVRPQDFHWTADEFYRAAAAGEFEDPDRLELIHGRLIRLMQGERHLKLRLRVSRSLRRYLEPPLFVCDECPLHIAFDGEPVPDVLVTFADEYEGRHPEPGDVALLVEVSDSSLEYDLGEKALLYAQAGVADYWVVPVGQESLLVHREPTAEGYRSVARLGLIGGVRPLAAADVTIPVRSLLTREEG